MLLPALPAAADEGRQVTRYAAGVTLAHDGSAHVVVDLDLDFADEPGHGVELELPSHVATDDGQVRVYDIHDVTASSSTGAPDDLDVEDDGETTTVRVGDPDVDDVDGEQSYEIAYTVDALVNPDSLTSDGDQLFWDAIGPRWQIPLSDVDVTVVGPDGVTRARCLAGEPGSDASCTAHHRTGAGATFHQDTVEPGEALTVVVGWPAGTFDVVPSFEQPDDADASGSDDGSGDDDWDGSGLGFPDPGQPGDLDIGDLGSFGSDGFGAFGGFAIVVGVLFVGVLVTIVVSVARRAGGSGGGGVGVVPTEVHSLVRRGYVRMDPLGTVGPGMRPNWVMSPLRPADPSLSAREAAWYAAMFGAGAATVAWSDVVGPAARASAGGWSGFGGGYS
ncbi:DUF2207 domain-containing protein, partial [Cellulomonas sp. HZM]|uniref:DUF2207 domain-containing protein n=1 Tax=Cellulomonas sp. HZM TaxID=1454010 RepID=UPI0018CC67B6